MSTGFLRFLQKSRPCQKRAAKRLFCRGWAGGQAGLRSWLANSWGAALQTSTAATMVSRVSGTI